MVDLEPVVDQTDIQALRNLIERHATETESPRARWILENFDTMLPKFVKVFPHEFKRVLGVERVKHQYIPPIVKMSGEGVLHG